MKERFRFVFISVFILHFSEFNAQEKVSTKASNVSILEKEFDVKSLGFSRKIWVYLPPNYENSSKKFPVIYMHDAQNLFDNATSYAGEWGIDETLNNLFKKTGKEFIVVGIENSGDQRIDEYTPFKNEKYGGGKGDFYIDFLVKELKPYIDTNFRTKPDAKNTAIIGSSLGGLISFYGGLKYPKVFGKIGAFSTSFWFSDEIYSFAKENGNHKNLKIYFLVGEKEGEEMVSDTEKMEKLLLKSGFPSKNIKTKIVPEGKHNEAFWKSEFLETLKFLFKI
ncbi:MAG: alpha/beta hydrolase-fold protein [Polaribacter sp.]|nr:alpha/beta hydrolase-fold protein [Polaribacter sp.]